MDISPLEGSVVLPIGVSRVNITLTILADQIPELEEAFSLRLTEAQGGAMLDAARTVSTFSVRCVRPKHWFIALVPLFMLR